MWRRFSTAYDEQLHKIYKLGFSAKLSMSAVKYKIKVQNFGKKQTIVFIYF